MERGNLIGNLKNHLKPLTKNQPELLPRMVKVLITLLSIVALSASTPSVPTNYAESFSHVSSGQPVNKLSTNHYQTSDQITKASDALRSKATTAAVEIKSAKKHFIESTKDTLSATHTAAHGVIGDPELNNVNTLRPTHTIPSSAAEKAAISADTTNKHYSKAVAATYHESLLEVASTSQSKVGVTGAASACEVCVYVVENKQMHQPFLCRGLKDPAYQQTVSGVFCLLLFCIYFNIYSDLNINEIRFHFVTHCIL